jgi:CDGSH-type Zn-finger protein
LSYHLSIQTDTTHLTHSKRKEMKMSDKKTNMKIKICKDGPYTVHGGIPLMDMILVPDAEGLSVGWHKGKEYPIQEEYDLCRCGQSKTKPFCDRSHTEIHFIGTETASREPFDSQAEPKTVGPELELTDVVALCSLARFCDRAGGVWNNLRASDDPDAKKIVLQEVGDCPAGRLVLHDKAGNLVEPEFEPSIGLVLDPVVAEIGPLWVRGSIPIESADGYIYEVRNRVTLCRCGKSTNKPFCDGRHTNGK